ncbi:DDE-type integrase/transposase/recombinase [Phytoactinopolyspora mesophila]|uniref:DDE-type integrase/transposase/recombinase n=1 Tax=Phytoactinopolyspora mesophila TaxID=2650750 RepID=UPI0013911D2B
MPDAPNRLWFTDITYIRIWGGWAYLAAIIDGYTRKIVGWSVNTHMRTSLVTDALMMALERQRPALGHTIIHSDRGSQDDWLNPRNILLLIAVRSSHSWACGLHLAGPGLVTTTRSLDLSILC